MLLKKTSKSSSQGFTLVELMVVIAIMGILAAVATPSILLWLPNYRLKNAARDVYSTLQNARLLAVKKNTSVRVYFNNAISPGFIVISVPDNAGNFTAALDQTGEYQVNLSSYGSGVDFGVPAGINNWANAAIVNSVTFPGAPPSFCTYNSDGTSGAGTVYLINNQATRAYAITTVTSGAVKLRKYNGILPFSTNNWIE